MRSVRVLGTDAVVANLRRLRPAVAEQELAGSLWRRGEEIMTVSKQLVPVDTGTLRSTGHVQLPERRGSEIAVTLGYGGPAAPYALRQHEELDYHHEVGQAKYLEQPALEAAPELAHKLARDVEQAIKRELG